MPHRYGYLRERVLTMENCLAAVDIGTKNLKKTRKVRYIIEHREEVAREILEVLQNDWTPEPVRHKIINDGTSRKRRELTIPTTRDHLIHVAIMLPLQPILERQFDFYCCGSVPGRGGRRANRAIQGWMKKGVRYCVETDVKKFYPSVKAPVVMRCLRRIVKDEEYLKWHEQILAQMGGSLAIGFQPSHWYGNLVLTRADRSLRAGFHGIKLVRYMDNLILFSNRKRTLFKAVQRLMHELGRDRLRLHWNWNVFPVSKRAPVFLSYRYYPGYTLMRKPVMVRVSRACKRAARHPCAHIARSTISQLGILRHCDSYNFRKTHVYPVVSIKRMKELISHDDKKRAVRRAA